MRDRRRDRRFAAEHALGPALYALKAVRAAGGSVAAERRWQDEELPEASRGLVLSARQAPRFSLRYSGWHSV